MTSSSPIPPIDRRLTELQHLDLPCMFKPPKTKAAWQSRAKALREHLLVSLGLWPMPDKCPLNPQIFDKIERDGYTIEKVYFESMPGFFVNGNLYRPRDGKGPFPGILNPHGHWKNGRLEDGKDGSIPARCIHFARQGAVAFAWDMIGYNDSTQIDHRFGGDRELLWGISMMGLQLWNSIRSIDFLQSLPEVDSRRIACTGASGGGTQTFMLTAVDDRIILSAPVNMISGHMQGGCLCENGPNIRIDTNNIEIGAMMAPRPMLMVSATGDWTVNTPDFEYPAIREVYRLFDAEDHLAHVQIDAGHNYNRDSREAVYAWFDKWLFDDGRKKRIEEQAYSAEKSGVMLVCASAPSPDHAVDGGQMVDYMIGQSRKQLEKLQPTDAKSLRKFRQMMSVALRSVVGAAMPERDDLVDTKFGRTKVRGYTVQRLFIGRKDAGDRIPAVLYTPDNPTGATLVVHPEGHAGLVDADRGALDPALRGLLNQAHIVLAVDMFMTGQARGPRYASDIHYLHTYNRSDAANRVQDIITAATYLREHTGESAVSLIGLGEAGLWGLLACGIDRHIARAVIDADEFDTDDDQSFLDKLFMPCLRRIGGIRAAAALAAPAELFIHNTGNAFQSDWIEEVYRTVNARERLKVSKRPAARQNMVEWAVKGAGRE